MTIATVTAPRPEELVLERRYKARPEELWALWTTKEGFESWWGPVGFRVEVHTLECRVGGLLHYDMIADGPEQIAAMKAMGQPLSHETRGRFTEIEPHRRLAITHTIDFLPGVSPYDNTMSVDFLPEGDTVRMVITLSPHLDPQLSRMSLEGCTSQLTKLEGRFSPPR
jgi:uncharacterized protein YndB with AHSA1/START domain